MKLKVNRSEFLATAAMVASATNRSSGIIFIYKCLRFDIVNNICTITGSDSETQLQADIKVDADEDFSFCVPEEIFLGTIRQLDAEIIGIVQEMNEDNNLIVSIMVGRKKHYKMSGENPVHFHIKPFIYGHGVTVDAEQFLLALENAASVVDEKDVRIINSIWITKQESTMLLVGSHSAVSTRQAIAIKGDGEFKEKGVIISKPAATIIQSLPMKQELTIYADNNVLYFGFNGVRAIILLTAGTYPDMSVYWNKQPGTYLTVNCNQIEEACKILQLYNTTALIRISIGKENMLMQAEDPMMGHSGFDRVPIGNMGVPEHTIGFNAGYLLSILNKIPCENVQIFMVGNEREAAFIIPAEDNNNPNQFWFVVPVVINNSEITQ